MILIWGQRFCGKVSVVPGLFYVATRFFHLWYIPLIPLGTYLVADDDAEEKSGRSIGFSVKSMLMGWARSAMVLGALLMLLWAGFSVFTGAPMVIDEYFLVHLPDDIAGAIEIPFILQALVFYGVVLFFALLCVLGYWLSTKITKAGYQQALALAEEAHPPREMIDRHFGKGSTAASIPAPIAAAPAPPPPGQPGQTYGQVFSQPFSK
jgi:hypothetical protein